MAMPLQFLFTLLGCLLFAVYGGLIAWYHRSWRALPAFQPGRRTGFRTRITVLIPARNEEENIGACLQSLAAQTYPRELFEVIVIDDHSTDRTAAIVKEFAVRYLSLASIPEAGAVTAHKKFALETGIGQAGGELIVTMDADCLAHPGWLLTLAACYEEQGAKFIAAPVRIGGAGITNSRGSHSLLAIFQTLDFITLQGITGAAVHKHVHSMCNGANLAYSREAFFEVEGFKGIDHIPSGDDMLLMHKIFLRYPDRVFFLKSREAIVSTRPETRWKGFFNQRIRWASKADRYDDKRIFRVLLLVYLVNLLFVVMAVAAFRDRWWGFLLLILLVVKTMIEYPFVGDVAGFFGQRRMMAWFPLLQPLHIIYTLVVGWLGKFGSYRWKDRIITK
jgi:cellulose synthase/poly-beta-1,6-N-acetylglucosamine synthase-like glycosyltransferase